MSGRVRLRDGVEVEFATGETVALDGQPPVEERIATVLSHAHGDHLVDSVDRVVASDLTAALAARRRDASGPTAVDHPAVELHNAGHIAGSRGARLSDPETGRTYLYLSSRRESRRLRRA